MKENLCVSCRNGQTNEELLCGICYNSWFNSCLKEELPKSVCISKSQELLAALERRLDNPEVNNDALNTLLDSINVLQCLEWLLTSPDRVSLSMKEYLHAVLSALLEKSNFSGQLFHRLVVYEHISTLIARKENRFLQKILLQSDDLWTDIQKYRKRHKTGLIFQKRLKRLKRELTVLLISVLLLLVGGFVLYVAEKPPGLYLVLSGALLAVLVVFLWISRYNSYDLNLSLKTRVQYQLEQFFVPEEYLASLQKSHDRLNSIVKNAST